MIFTIGHTIQSLDDFYDMLRHYDVNCIIDVRSMPFSKHAPQFNKESLNSFTGNIRREWALTNGIGGYAGSSWRSSW